MKLSIDLEGQYGYDDESIAEMFRSAVREEIRLASKRIAKDAIKKMEVEAKKVIDKAVKKDWKKIQVLMEQLEKEVK